MKVLEWGQWKLLRRVLFNLLMSDEMILCLCGGSSGLGGVCEWGLGMLREREEEGTVRRRCQFCWGCDTSDYAKGRRFGGLQRIGVLGKSAIGRCRKTVVEG